MRHLHFSEYTRSRLQKNDLLFSIAGAIGRTAIVTDDILPANTNQALALIRIPEGVINYSYLKYVLQSSVVSDQFEKRKQGVAQLNISLKDVANFNIPLPSQAAQQMIVEILGGVEVIISLRKQQLAKLDELVKSRFVEMFGDPVENTKKWTVHFLCDVCTKLTDGTHFSPESYETGEYRYVTAKNIKISGFDFSNITYVNADVHNEIYARCNPEYGDVLYIKDGVTTGIAMVNTLHEPFTMLSSVALLKQNRAIVDGTYLCGVLNNQHMYDAIRSDMGGAAITRLTITKLNRIEIPVPPLALQQQFTAFVEQIDKSKLAVQQSIDQLETLKKSLMQKYFG